MTENVIWEEIPEGWEHEDDVSSIGWDGKAVSIFQDGEMMWHALPPDVRLRRSVAAPESTYADLVFRYGPGEEDVVRFPGDRVWGSGNVTPAAKLDILASTGDGEAIRFQIDEIGLGGVGFKRFEPSPWSEEIPQEEGDWWAANAEWRTPRHLHILSAFSLENGNLMVRHRDHLGREYGLLVRGPIFWSPALLPPMPEEIKGK